MPDSVESNHRLEELKRRFEADPGSRLYLQLADEYRRLGQHPEAIGVLQTGLEQRPRDLTGLLALGRCHLEMGSDQQAAEILEGVVERDPTHIVANKLVLEAHLQSKDFEKAKQRLDIYRLLNDRDPELDHLQFRLDRLRNDPSEVPTEVLDQHSIFDFPVAQQDEPAETDSAPVGEEIFQLAAARSAAGASPASGVDVFDFVPRPPASRPRADTDAGGVFSFLSRPAAVPAVADVEPAAPQIEALPESEPPSSAAALPAVGEAAGRDAVEEDVEESRQGAEGASSTPMALVDTEAADAVDPDLDISETPSEEGSAADQGAVADAVLHVVAEPETEVTAEAEPSAAELESADEPANRESTVTLAELYLEQGHLSEAEEIFQQVLKRDPGSAAARAGMRQIAARQAGELTASELLVESGEARPRGLTERKVTVLKRYLQRLRGARNVR